MAAIQILGDAWDPITGCTKISPGCRNCYAERFTEWINRMGNTDKYAAGFSTVVCHDDQLQAPLKRKKAKVYFVNSMADTFHKDVPTDFIRKMFAVMNTQSQHTFQLLTKRSDRLAQEAPYLKWTDNIWMGVSVENQDYVSRIDDLRMVPAKLRYIMFEPLLGPVGTIDLTGIQWAIVGGESGEGFRAMEADWVREIRDQCVAAGVKFVFKQYAAVKPEKLGRGLDGKVWDEKP